MYHQNSICNSNPSVNLGTWLISLMSIWRYQILDLAEDVDEWLNIFHMWRDSTPPDFQNIAAAYSQKSLSYWSRWLPPDL